LITKAFFTELPAEIQYMPLPSAAGADLWMRKNIAEVTDPETGAVSYEADEAYMRTDVGCTEIEADFNGWYEKASEWQPPQPTLKLTSDERIAALEKENKALNEQLSATMEAVDFLLFGADEEV
jgi:hypothetical protein